MKNREDAFFSLRKWFIYDSTSFSFPFWIGQTIMNCFNDRSWTSPFKKVSLFYWWIRTSTSLDKKVFLCVKWDKNDVTVIDLIGWVVSNRSNIEINMHCILIIHHSMLARKPRGSYNIKHKGKLYKIRANSLTCFNN
jgi:hypothetical protein